MGWGGYKKHLCLLPTPDFGRKVDPVDYYTIPVKASVCIKSCGTSEETNRCCMESWGRCYHRGSNWIGLRGMRRSFTGGQGEERRFRPEEQHGSGWSLVCTYRQSSVIATNWDCVFKSWLCLLPKWCRAIHFLISKMGITVVLSHRIDREIKWVEAHEVLTTGPGTECILYKY